jgi:hypothetical protein
MGGLKRGLKIPYLNSWTIEPPRSGRLPTRPTRLGLRGPQGSGDPKLGVPNARQLSGPKGLVPIGELPTWLTRLSLGGQKAWGAPKALEPTRLGAPKALGPPRLGGPKAGGSPWLTRSVALKAGACKAWVSLSVVAPKVLGRVYVTKPIVARRAAPGHLLSPWTPHAVGLPKRFEPRGLRGG